MNVRAKFHVNQRVMSRTHSLFFTGQVMAYWVGLDGVMTYVVERVECGQVLRFIASESSLEPLSFGRTTDAVKLAPGGKY